MVELEGLRLLDVGDLVDELLLLDVDDADDVVVRTGDIEQTLVRVPLHVPWAAAGLDGGDETVILGRIEDRDRVALLIAHIDETTRSRERRSRAEKHSRDGRWRTHGRHAVSSRPRHPHKAQPIVNVKS